MSSEPVRCSSCCR